MDLYRAYMKVINRGGYEAVNKNNSRGDVALSLGVIWTNMTGSRMRIFYFNYLADFEKSYSLF